MKTDRVNTIFLAYMKPNVVSCCFFLLGGGGGTQYNLPNRYYFNHPMNDGGVLPLLLSLSCKSVKSSENHSN